MSFPLFLVVRVKYLQSTYLTHVSMEVKAAISEVACSRCSVGTQLLSNSTGASSYWIFQSAANSFQIRMGLHFRIIILVTATHHITCGAGFLLFFIKATQILGNRNIVWTNHTRHCTKPTQELPCTVFPVITSLVFVFFFLEKVFFSEISSLSSFCSQIIRIFTNCLLKSLILRFLQLFSVYK